MKLKPGHVIILAGTRDGREYWNVFCGCGWWHNGCSTRRIAQATLGRHTKQKHPVYFANAYERIDAAMAYRDVQAAR